MNILINNDILQHMYYHREDVVHTQRRYCYLAEPPRLAVLICRGAPLHDLIGRVVDTNIGYEDGYAGFCVRGYEGQHHTKITVYQVTGEPYKRTLLDILDESYVDSSKRWKR